MAEAKPKQKKGKDNKAKRYFFLRVSSTNKIKKDNKDLNLKAGTVLKYDKDSIKKILDAWACQKILSYYFIEHKPDDDDNNIHYHIVIDFKFQGYWDVLKKKFPVGYISEIESTVLYCVQYLVHFNDPEKEQYDWSEIITNNPAQLDLYISQSTTKQLSVDAYIHLISKGDIREFEIVEKVPATIYSRHRSKLENALEYYRIKKSNDYNRKVKLIVLQGDTRTGKTSFCKKYAMAHDKSIAFSAGSGDPWGSYRGQDIFVYNDFDPNEISAKDFKTQTDPNYRSDAKARYHDRTFLGDTLIITSNTPVEKWYVDTEHKKFNISYEDRLAIIARISEIYCFKLSDNEDYSYLYTITPNIKNETFTYNFDSVYKLKISTLYDESIRFNPLDLSVIDTYELVLMNERKEVWKIKDVEVAQPYIDDIENKIYEEKQTIERLNNEEQPPAEYLEEEAEYVEALMKEEIDRRKEMELILQSMEEDKWVVLPTDEHPGVLRKDTYTQEEYDLITIYCPEFFF